MKRNHYAWLAAITAGFTFIVVIVGAYTRLTDAGLGCPDWPGCYGHLVLPGDTGWIDEANAAFPERPVELFKAWVEMIHRHLAKLLGLAIIALAFFAWRNRHDPQQPLRLPMALVGLVIFQGILGMWTVTQLLKPAIVMAHLLGGMTILALLWLLAMRSWQVTLPNTPAVRRWRPWGYAALVLLVLQIALGGWTSTNYAALACTHFPTCDGRWWPPMDFAEATVLWRGLGIDYEYGVLDAEARVAIHMMHRIGALVVTLYFVGLIVALLRSEQALQRAFGALIGATLALQLALGIGNIVLFLPLWVAVGHNAGAALLLLVTVSWLQSLYAPQPERLRVDRPMATRIEGSMS